MYIIYEKKIKSQLYTDTLAKHQTSKVDIESNQVEILTSNFLDLKLEKNPLVHPTFLFFSFTLKTVTLL